MGTYTATVSMRTLALCVYVCGAVWDVHTPLPPFACVGKSHDQSVGLPRGLDPEKTAFGLSTIKGTYIDTHTSHTQVGFFTF